MTLKELKNLHQQYLYFVILKNKIEKSTTLNKADKQKRFALIDKNLRDIIAKTTKCISLFNSSGRDVAYHIKQTFEQKLPNAQIEISHVCTKQLFNNTNLDEYLGELFLEIKVLNKGEQETIKVLTRATVIDKSENQDYLDGNYDINAFALLFLDSEIPYSRIIYNACFDIAENKLRQLCNIKLNSIKKRRKYLTTKRYGLIDGLTRLKTIENLSKEIDDLANMEKQFTENFEEQNVELN